MPWHFKYLRLDVCLWLRSESSAFALPTSLYSFYFFIYIHSLIHIYVLFCSSKFFMLTINLVIYDIEKTFSCGSHLTVKYFQHFLLNKSYLIELIYAFFCDIGFIYIFEVNKSKTQSILLIILYSKVKQLMFIIWNPVERVQKTSIPSFEISFESFSKM